MNASYINDFVDDDVENSDFRGVGKAFTRDPDYAAFTGRVVRTISTTYYDPKLKAWIKRTCEYIDVGRSDTVCPADNPDAVIADDGTDVDGKPRRIRAMRSGTMEMLERIRELLAERPHSTAELAAALGMTMNRTKAIMANNPSGFVVINRNRGGMVYGLKGNDYPSYLRLGMDRIVEYLKANGPQALSVISERLPMRYRDVHRAIDANPGALCIVGEARNQRGRYNLWGVVGVHGKEAA